MNQLLADRHIHWEQIAAQCAQFTDALGEAIDPDIFNLVVALNAFGITTCASCAGHLDSGAGAPYVDIEAIQNENDRTAAQQAHRALFEAEEAEQQGQLTVEEIDAKYQAATEAQRRAGYRHLLLRARLTELLTAFYATRHVPFNQRLVIQGEVIQGIGGPMRLENQGAGLQTLATTEAYRQNLQHYQDEMQAFAAFLKERFFTPDMVI